jgi:hypothetical protein
MRLVRWTARRSSIEVIGLNENDTERYFLVRQARTKQDIANILARTFPALAWKLPPPRKAWQHEHAYMPMFDAAALGMSYFYENGKRCD